MKIPVTITYQGKEYHGQLSRVMGAYAEWSFHLMINDLYWGVFWWVATWNEWRFDSGTMKIDNSTKDYFEMVLISYYS